MKKSLLVSLIASLTVSLSSLTLAAPGHGGGHHGANNIGQPGKAAEASRTVEVTMYDNYYEPEEISVDEGETVRFVVKNEGMLVHEFNIGTAEMHAAHQDEMTMMVEHGVIQSDAINHEMMKMDMGNGQTMEHDDPNSVLLEPGKTAEVVWTFGENADLEFACNVPGHYDAGMMGQIEVQ
ncbi:cupredoxin domain-containing protein [Hydrocarboniclastica marina]|uniref:Copper-binding protein n=1 Tax=Hydrocarboniclastica marina TaxID=2259620 RepID=A0A4P7XIF1_9ALTE|nr:cupredoxin family protein [Hydrocarboniclastica marina]QCF26505.1 copper-binding protein [Hydrocarboniclastica marina]